MDTIALFAGWAVAIFAAILGIVILVYIITGKIDLKYVISEEDGSASLSRFQFLIFTFVIALSLLLVIVSQNPPGFPTIPPEIFILLGISGGTYVISKGVQKSWEKEVKKKQEPENNAEPPAVG